MIRFRMALFRVDPVFNARVGRLAIPARVLYRRPAETGFRSGGEAGSLLKGWDTV
jgi:hypothetical protein